jgi:hypothetical protein
MVDERRIDAGIAGGPAQREYERRVARHEQRIEERFGTGRLGRFVKLVSDEPASTTAWAKGAEGERRLAQRLNEVMGERGVVLHDRRVPNARGNIDHLVVAPSGVWVIDAKRYTGTVQRRDIGGWFRTDERLFVNGRDRSKLVENLTWQAQAVHAALGNLDSDDLAVRPVLCFVDADWPWFAKPFTLSGVTVTWPGELCDRASATGPLSPEQVDGIARRLSGALPANAP